MKKNTTQKKKPKTEKEIIVARYTLVGSIIIGLIGLLGTIITIYNGNLSNRESNKTQTPDLLGLSLTIAPTDQLVNPTIDVSKIDPETGYLIVYPDCQCEINVNAEQPILVRLMWGGKTAELAKQGSNLILYSLVIDGQEVLSLVKKEDPVFEVNPPLEGDPDNAWWMYWDYALKFQSGSETHHIQATRITLGNINNGWQEIPTGVKNLSEVQVKTFFSPFLKECEDGVDNDADGYIDFPNDAQCSTRSDPHEDK